MAAIARRATRAGPRHHSPPPRGMGRCYCSLQVRYHPVAKYCQTTPDFAMPSPSIANRCHAFQIPGLCQVHRQVKLPISPNLARPCQGLPRRSLRPDYTHYCFRRQFRRWEENRTRGTTQAPDRKYILKL
jgi:hypothetical protein